MKKKIPKKMLALTLLLASGYALAEGCGPWWCKFNSTSLICNCQVSK